LPFGPISGEVRKTECSRAANNCIAFFLHIKQLYSRLQGSKLVSVDRFAIIYR
jgi:hypothetical protein